MIAKRFKDTKFDAVYTSDLGRAHNTAKIIISQNQINSDEGQIRLAKLARERDFPGFENQPIELIRSHPSNRDYKGPPRDFKVPGGESTNDMTKRSGKLLLEISDEAFKPENHWKQVLLVSHQGWICESQNFVANYNTGEAYSRRDRVKNCSVSILEVQKAAGEGAGKAYKFDYLVVSDVEHLNPSFDLDSIKLF